MPWFYTCDKNELVLVSEEDYDWAKSYKWRQVKDSYVIRRESKLTFYLHIEILKRMGFTNFEKGDHKNRDVLDNRRSNLRVATNFESSWNTRLSSRSTTGYKGVSYSNRDGKWMTQITVKGDRLFLGRFDTPEEAYKKAAQKYYGEFCPDYLT